MPLWPSVHSLLVVNVCMWPACDIHRMELAGWLFWISTDFMEFCAMIWAWVRLCSVCACWLLTTTTRWVGIVRWVCVCCALGVSCTFYAPQFTFNPIHFVMFSDGVQTTLYLLYLSVAIFWFVVLSDRVHATLYLLYLSVAIFWFVVLSDRVHATLYLLYLSVAIFWFVVLSDRVHTMDQR